MSSRTEKDKTKQLQDKCQAVLNELLRDEDNKYCVDCDSKGPRWASWNLGVFLCIRCAGIHRNLGVHISKVKSVNLDTWTPEQVVSLQQMGNSRARAVYEANLPDNFRRPQNDSNLETFIRAKYEHKKYIAREWVPLPLPKVNWEKEIEEEMEKQKRKKKTVIEKKSIGNVEVPQLPKPKHPSPKPGRASSSSGVVLITATTTATTTTTTTAAATTTTDHNKHTTDLLGLQNGEDGFGSFLSAPQIAKDDRNDDGGGRTADEIGRSEEESFFNQTAPTEKEKAKLTKDSILALYGNTPPTMANYNPTYPNQAATHVPYATTAAAGFPQQQQQPFPHQQNFNYQQQRQNYQMQNGIPQRAFGQHHQFSMQNVNQFGGAGGGGGGAMPQFGGQFGGGGASATAQVQFQQNLQFPAGAQHQFGQYQQNFGAQSAVAVPNPFFANQHQQQQSLSLQQQFGALSLNGQTAACNPTPTPLTTTNIWQ
ncbi:hypothetical protein MML48_2g00019479 [Holotrichia oblita]|uniref:Uncharacterized protein n=1 Tax=Holotrichia oblita TaxID=644536 RepID=A0ACB9TR77_HOLOL|nr:hypothetical protein MML48_2g00019479 [Holotrichia oblita]